MTLPTLEEEGVRWELVYKDPRLKRNYTNNLLPNQNKDLVFLVLVGTFAKLRKGPTSIVMLGRLPLSPQETTRFPLVGFS